MEWCDSLPTIIAVVVTLIPMTPILAGLIYRGTTRKAPPARMHGKTVIVTGASAGKFYLICITVCIVKAPISISYLSMYISMYLSIGYLCIWQSHI